MSLYAPANIIAFASTRETSLEIALAIYELADEGDESRMWESPTPFEQLIVTRRAWQLANPFTTELHWGCETLRVENT